MNVLNHLLGDDITKLIIEKLDFNKCIFENCSREAGMLGKYCKRHWCIDGHPTTQKKYRGYCDGCFTRIMKTDNKMYLRLVTRNYHQYFN